MAVPRYVRVLIATSFVLLVAYVARAALSLGGSTAQDVFGRYVYDAIGFAAVLAIAARAPRPGQRLAWGLIAGGLALWSGGNVLYDVFDLANAAVPSGADAFWLAMYLPTYAGVVLLVRPHVRRVGAALWLDGLIAALAMSALSVEFVLQRVVRTAGGGSTAALITNVAYPACDLLLIGLIVAAGTVTGWRLGRSFGLLAVAYAAFWVSDSVFLVQSAQDGYVPGGLVDIGWLAAAPLMAMAAWARAPTADWARGTRRVGHLVPIGFGLVAILFLAVHRRGFDVSALIAVATLLAILVRLALSYRENDRLLAVSQNEAATDQLTGLANRRSLLADLERASRIGADEILVLFDLDGFKLYNDTFGHPAGDELLVRIAEGLARAAGRGCCYRLGGDEFCIRLPTPAVSPDAWASGVAAAIAQRGEGFLVTAAHGAVRMPLEARDATEALRLADRRMYAQKGNRRVSASRQSADVLLASLGERWPSLGVHVSAVSALAEATALRLGIEEPELGHIRTAAALHDIGKMAVPDEILHKPGPLTDSQAARVRRHTIIGERILAAAPSLVQVARLVRSSHERWDGRGYPDGLAGKAIPLGSRIIFACDAFDAMTTDRPYDSRRSVAEALDELRRCAGAQFDPEIMAALVAVVEGIAPRGLPAPRAASGTLVKRVPTSS